MKEDLLKKFFALLRYELISENQPIEKDFISFDELPILYGFSKRYDLAHLVGDALEKNGLLDQSEQAKTHFLNERNVAVLRYEQKQYEFEQICSVLENAKIPFVPLKGAIIQNMYPEPWMRTSCDIDILVKKEDLSLATQLLKQDLSYTGDFVGTHDAQLYSPNGVHLELHFTLTTNKATPVQQKAFENVFNYDATNQSFKRKMSYEDFYGYFVLHTAMHLREGGCGIRPLLDIWLMQQQPDYDKAKCDQLLLDIGLLTFEKAINNLLQVWFFNKDATLLDKQLEEFIIAGNLYGTTENNVLVKTKRKKGKLRFLLSRIFIPYNDLKIQYPKLQKCPILFLYYQVKRWFNLLNKEKRNRVKNELNLTIKANTEKSQQIANLFKELQL